MSANEGSDSDVSISRRDVLKGATTAGVGMTGATAATGSAKAGSISGGCVTDWPAEMQRRINVEGREPTEHGEVPESGELVLYVHGLFGEDVLDSVDINGANQAASLEAALAAEYADRAGEPPEVVPVMWDSTTTWTVAKWRADDAGQTLAAWLEANAQDYESITVVAHSLGTRVTLEALDTVETATVDSVALLGGAVDPDAACTEYKASIESHVDGTVYNYHSENDTIVCRIYAIREWTSAIGCAGRDCGGGWFSSGTEPPANYAGVDVTEQVQGHCYYYRHDTDEFDGGNCVGAIVENQLRG